MQCIGNGPGFFISDELSFIWWQIFGCSLDLIQLTDVFQGLCRQFTLIGLLQVVELTTGMSQATDFGDAVAEAGFVTRIIVADQFALPVSQERTSVLASPACGYSTEITLAAPRRCQGSP